MAVEEHAGVFTIPISDCSLSLRDAPWEFADRCKDDIAAHWARCRTERPKLFNGTVYLMRTWAAHRGTLNGTFLRTDFKSYLYWRETGFGEAGVRDAFGCSLIRSAEGAVLLGRQAEGHLNSGLAYPPAGMFDASDAGSGRIDLDGNIERELGEETGLRSTDLTRTPGYLATIAGPLISIAIEWRSALQADALRQRILEHIRAQAAPELDDIVIVRRSEEIDHVPMPAYAQAMLRRILCA